MDELRKAVDIMDLQLTHSRLIRSRLKILKSQSIIVERERQWQDTIDPQTLVLGKVIGRGGYGVVHKGSYQGQTVGGNVLDFSSVFFVDFNGVSCCL